MKISIDMIEMAVEHGIDGSTKNLIENLRVTTVDT